MGLPPSASWTRRDPRRFGHRIGVSSPHAKDLELIKPQEYKELAQRTSEVKRMLAALVQKLNAESSQSPDFNYPWIALAVRKRHRAGGSDSVRPND